MVDRGQLVSLSMRFIDWAFFFMYIASFTFPLWLSLMLSSETPASWADTVNQSRNVA